MHNILFRPVTKKSRVVFSPIFFLPGTVWVVAVCPVTDIRLQDTVWTEKLIMISFFFYSIRSLWHNFVALRNSYSSFMSSLFALNFNMQYSQGGGQFLSNWQIILFYNINYIGNFHNFLYCLQINLKWRSFELTERAKRWGNPELYIPVYNCSNWIGVFSARSIWLSPNARSLQHR